MILGHKKQWGFLRNKFELGQLSHAYLLTGERQLGKKTFAKEIAKIINCTGENKSCGECNGCRLIEKGSHPDLLIVERKEDQKEIQIAQIRDAQNFLGYKSYYGGYKTVIVDNAEEMSIEAQNCFLKTLEEPKGRTIIFMISSNPALLLSTIYSRCQNVKFFKVKDSEIKEYLRSQGLKSQDAELVSLISEGRPGRADEFVKNPDKLSEDKNAVQEIIKIADSELGAKFQFSKSTDLEGERLKKIFEVLQRYFRHLLLLKTGAGNANGFYPEPTAKQKSYSVEKIKNILELIEKVDYKISSTNASPKLALEVVLMQL